MLNKFILVINGESLKKSFLKDYDGKTSLKYVKSVNDITLKQKISEELTVLFVEEKKEIYRLEGKIMRLEFYKTLGKLILGEMEYGVAFHEGTEPQFCSGNLDEKRKGAFHDPLSGAKLFESGKKFESGTGWPSFTNPILNSVEYKQDNNYGMIRTEVLSKSSGMHLGHVFDDGPNGMKRYCINGSVLEFRYLK